MSAYAEVETQFMDAECLQKALQRMFPGNEEHIQRHAEPVNLYGYHRDIRDEKAEIVIPGSGHPCRVNLVGGLSNDIGFRREGKYLRAVISQYDAIRHGSEWLGAVKALYAEEVVLKSARQMGATVTKKVVEGKTVLELTRWC